MKSRTTNKLKTSTWSIGLISTSYFFSYLPVIIIIILEESHVHIAQQVGVFFYTYASLFASGVVNPLVYAACSKEYRTTVRRALCKPTRISGDLSILQTQKHESTVGAVKIISS